MKLVLATRSGHKLNEIRAILRGLPKLHLLDLNDVGVPPSPVEEEIEEFDSFEENAFAKVRYFEKLTGLPTLADDSGLVVDALGGAPGVRSKRFAPSAAEFTGNERDRENVEHLLRELSEVPIVERTARYICIAALVATAGEDPTIFTGTVEGLILGRGRGQGGFGYDPVFFDRSSGKTFAELTPGEKNAISHRGASFRAVANHLSKADS